MRPDLRGGLAVGVVERDEANVVVRVPDGSNKQVHVLGGICLPGHLDVSFPRSNVRIHYNELTDIIIRDESKTRLAITNLGHNLIVHRGVNKDRGVLVLESLLVNTDLVVTAGGDWLDGVEALAVKLDAGGDRDQLAIVLDEADEEIENILETFFLPDIGHGLSHGVVIDAVSSIDFQSNVRVEGGGGGRGGGGGGGGGGGRCCWRRAGPWTVGGGGGRAVTECDVFSHRLQVVGSRAGAGGRGEPGAAGQELENIWKHFPLPDEERNLVALAGVKYSIPTDVGNIDGLDILHQVPLAGGGHDGGAPDLELLHLATEPQLQQPAASPMNPFSQV